VVVLELNSFIMSSLKEITDIDLKKETGKKGIFSECMMSEADRLIKSQ
jgi:hypothetical protein